MNKDTTVWVRLDKELTDKLDKFRGRFTRSEAIREILRDLNPHIKAHGEHEPKE